MLVLNGAFEFINYPGAKYSFTNPAADKAAWSRMQVFLKQVFEK